MNTMIYIACIIAIAIIFFILHSFKISIRKIKDRIDDADNEIAKIKHPFKYQIGDKICSTSTELTECGSYDNRTREGIVVAQDYSRNGRIRDNFYSIVWGNKSLSWLRESELKPAKEKGKKTK